MIAQALISVSIYIIFNAVCIMYPILSLLFTANDISKKKSYINFKKRFNLWPDLNNLLIIIKMKEKVWKHFVYPKYLSYMRRLYTQLFPFHCCYFGLQHRQIDQSILSHWPNSFNHSCLWDGSACISSILYKTVIYLWQTGTFFLVFLYNTWVIFFRLVLRGKTFLSHS